MRIIETSLTDVKIIEPTVFGDERGFFMETWSQRAFAEHGIEQNFVQDKSQPFGARSAARHALSNPTSSRQAGSRHAR